MRSRAFNLTVIGVMSSLLLCRAAPSPVLSRAIPPDVELARRMFDSVGTVPAEDVKQIQHELLLSPSNAGKQKILFTDPWSGDASNITYGFVNNSVSAPTGGSIVLSSVDTFPALTGMGMTMAIGFVNPCGLNTPHLHPRANEFLTVIQGQLVASLILELDPGSAGTVKGGSKSQYGAIPQINATLSNFTGILFPVGETHFQFNPTCEPAVFAAAFDSNDPGRTQIAANFFSVLPDEVLQTATGGNLEMLEASRLDKLRDAIPNDVALMMGQCAKQCGIDTSG